MSRIFIYCVLFTPIVSIALEGHRPDSHAPISIMGDHTHAEGEWMVSYRAMFMQMDEIKSGTDSVKQKTLLDEGYMMAPTKMEMTMHMLGLMYAQSDQLTWMIMLPFIQHEMTMESSMMNGMNGMNDMQSHAMSHLVSVHGIGDLKATALINLYENSQHKLHVGIGLSFPTGSIDEKNKQGDTLAYGMQLGSGTWDFRPSLTYVKQMDSWSLGAQGSGKIALGKNDRHYRLGNQYKASGWAAKLWTPALSTALQLSYQYQSAISGEDMRLNPAMSPSMHTDFQGGEQIFVGLSSNFMLTHNQRFAIEYQLPVYQDLNGPQLATSELLSLGYQLAF